MNAATVDFIDGEQPCQCFRTKMMPVACNYIRAGQRIRYGKKVVPEGNEVKGVDSNELMEEKRSRHS